MNYKVIGYFEDAGEVWTRDIDAEDPHTAMFEASKERKDGDLVIVCAIGPEGVTCPCEDSGRIASAETLYLYGAAVKWTIAGEDEQECSLIEWMDQNDDVEAWGAVERMEQGERVMMGGGAQPLFECWMPCWAKQV